MPSKKREHLEEVGAAKGEEDGYGVEESILPPVDEFEPSPPLLRERTLSPEPIASSSKLAITERHQTLSPSKWMSRNLKGSMKRRSMSALQISKPVENQHDARDESPKRQRSRSKSTKPTPGKKA